LALHLDLKAVFERFATLAVSNFADWCVVDLAATDTEIERVAESHRDPDKVEKAQRFLALHPKLRSGGSCVLEGPN
jgi:hypothetical protein